MLDSTHFTSLTLIHLYVQCHVFTAYLIKYGSLQTWDGPNGPKVADQKWPDGRGLHSVACLVDPESDLAASSQRVVVFWGEGIEAKILNDIWILSVTAMSWMQVCTIIKSLSQIRLRFFQNVHGIIMS